MAPPSALPPGRAERPPFLTSTAEPTTVIVPPRPRTGSPARPSTLIVARASKRTAPSRAVDGPSLPGLPWSVVAASSPAAADATPTRPAGATSEMRSPPEIRTGQPTTEMPCPLSTAKPAPSRVIEPDCPFKNPNAAGAVVVRTESGGLAVAAKQPAVGQPQVVGRGDGERPLHVQRGVWAEHDAGRVDEGEVGVRDGAADRPVDA